MTRVMVAVSLPKHRTTGNWFRAPSEEAALSMALGLGCIVEIGHVSQSKDCSALGVYSGLGARRLVWLISGNPGAALAEYATRRKIDLILTGVQAMQGMGSGMLPYELAHRLGWPILGDARRLVGSAGNWTVETGMQFGRRQKWMIGDTMVLTVGHETEEPLLPRFAETRYARVSRLDVEADTEQKISLVPANPRPEPLPAPPTGPYDVRLRTLLGAGAMPENRKIIEADESDLGRILVEEVGKQRADRTIPASAPGRQPPSVEPEQ